MDEKFAILRRGPEYNTTDGIGYNTLQQAADDGAVVLAYGLVSPFNFSFGFVIDMILTLPRTFLNKIINFLGVGFALYLIASIYDTMSSESIIKTTVKCRYCRKRISGKVLLPDII